MKNFSSEEQLQTNTSPTPAVATQNSVLLSGLHFLISQLKMKAEQARMERFGNGLLAVKGT